MNVFEKVVHQWQADKNFDLMSFLASLEPISSQSYQIHMGRFDVDSLRNCILLNIYSQGLVLKSKTINDLINFLKKDFTDTTRQIYLEALLHFVKMDASAMQSNKAEPYRIPPSEYYNEKIAVYLMKTLYEDLSEDYTITTVSEELKAQIKGALLQKSMLKAFNAALSMVSSNVHDLNIHQAICDMEIYSVYFFLPVTELRGVCLSNGIMLNKRSLAQPGLSLSYHADLITLAAHLCSHYLARLYSNNLNLSRPLNLESPSHEVERTDPSDTKSPLELGRCVELALFDGIQPNWQCTSELAAKAFIERLMYGEGIPVIKKREHKMLHLSRRKVASVPIGIDMEEIEIPMC